MTTQEPIRAIACPKCGAQYKLRADFQGNVKCKQCQRPFSVGVSQAQRKGAKTRDTHDQKTAVKLIVICGVALLVVAGIVVMAGNTDSGTTKSSRPRTKSTGTALPAAGSYTKIIDNFVDKRLIKEHCPTMARKFLRAMADADADTINDLFLFDAYFTRVDKNQRKKENKYHGASEELQAAKRAMVIAELTDAYLCEILKTNVLPALESGEEWVWASQENDEKSAGMRLRGRDDAGKDLILIDLEMALRPGMEGRDAERFDSWGISKISRKWLQKTLGSKKADKGMVDIGHGTDWKKNRAARKAGGKGPPEDDPSRQAPVAGTTPAQESTIQGHVRVLVDIGTSGPDLNKARTALETAGKYAIPFLLNELLERDHGDDEADILAANTCIQKLRDITGESFGYRPGRATGFGQSQVTATAEERTKAVRRWFGWWQMNHRTWNGKTIVDEVEEEEDGDDR